MLRGGVASINQIRNKIKGIWAVFNQYQIFTLLMRLNSSTEWIPLYLTMIWDVHIFRTASSSISYSRKIKKNKEIFNASATKHLGIGMSVDLSVCRLVSTQLSKTFGWHHARSILYCAYRLCTLVGALEQYMFAHSHGQNTVRNRARILEWASTLQSFAVRRWLAMTYSMGIMGNESYKKIDRLQAMCGQSR